MATEEELFDLLKEVLPYAYEAADQTVQCPCCNAVWWDVPENIDEDWHAPGCKIQQARVRVGISTSVRKRPPTEPSEPYKPNEPNPDTRTPAQILRDQVLSGFFQKLAAMQWAVPPPDGVDKAAWEKSIQKVIHQLLETDAPERGAYSAG